MTTLILRILTIVFVHSCLCVNAQTPIKNLIITGTSSQTGTMSIGTAGVWTFGTGSTLTFNPGSSTTFGTGSSLVINTGTLGVIRGGTGLVATPTAGQVLIGTANGSYNLSTLTAGSNVTITNGTAGTVTIAAAGGLVTGTAGIVLGGTGLATLPSTGQVLIGTGTGGYNLSTLTAGTNVTITSGTAGTITLASTGGFLTTAGIPSTGTSAGTAGQAAYDHFGLYVCTATGTEGAATWQRVAFTTIVPATTYTYVSDGDANGIFYGLGVLAGGTAGWVNPHTGGTLTVTANTFGAGTGADLVDRATSEVYDVTTGGFFKFDLGAARSAEISRFSFRSRSGSNQNHATSFVLEGSNNNTTWTTVHSEPTVSLTAINAWFTSTAIPATSFYRYFRLRMPTPDYPGGLTSITGGEVELYGRLRY